MELIDLYVELCSDGSLMAYDKNKSINSLFTGLDSWSKLKLIYECTIKTSAERKGKSKEQYNIKYVKYYFKNTQTNEIVEIPKEHICNIINSLK